MTQRLVYIANARMPTEKAHGYQIAKMCEAFMTAGADVTLVAAQRRPSSTPQDLFQFYSISRKFPLCRISAWDLFRLEPYVPGRAVDALFLAQSLAWSLKTCVSVGRGGRKTIFYTRDVAVAFWLTRFGLPTVFEAHAVPGTVQRNLLRMILRRRSLIHLVVITKALREAFSKIPGPERAISVEADAVDLNAFSGQDDRIQCRRACGLPDDVPIVGCIGRFHTMGKEKGIPELLKAVAMLPEIGGKRPMMLCVGGPMDAVAAYHKLARECGLDESRYRFVDRRPSSEVPQWVRACDAVTIPWPWTEHYAYFASPMKMFEYMASGRPIVASDLPSLRDVLRDRENALLTPPGNPTALAHALADVLRSPELANRLAETAREDVNRFTWTDRARRILDASTVALARYQSSVGCAA